MNKTQEILNTIFEICFEDESEELSKELISMQKEIEYDEEDGIEQDDKYFLKIIEEVINIIYIYSESFNFEKANEIQEIYLTVADI